MIADPMLLPLMTALSLCVVALGVAVRANRRMTSTARALRLWLTAPDGAAAASVANGGGADFAALIRSLQDYVERTAAEQRRLSVGEGRYRAIFEQAMEGIYQSTPDGRFLEVNDAMVRMFGFDSAEQMKASVTDIAGQIYADPGTRELFVHLMHEHGIVCGIELRAWQRDGGIVWIEENSHAVRDATGAVLYYEGTVQDITARKRAEEALRLSEERFRNVADAASDYIWEVDAAGRYTFVTDRVAAVIGYAPCELIGRSPFEFMPAEDRQTIRAVLNDFCARRAPFTNLEHRSIAKDGSIVQQRVSGIPMFDDSGALAGYRGAATNITAEVEAKQERKRTAEKLQAMLRAVPDLMFQVAADGTYLDCHVPSPDLLELPPERMLGRRMTEVLPPQVAGPAMAALDTAIRIGQVQTLEYALHRRQGEPLHFEGRIAPLQEGGALPLLLTARRKAEQVLRESEQRYRLLADNATDMISLHAPDGTYRYASPSALRLMGYSSEELAGRNPYDFCHPDDAGAVREAHDAIVGAEGIRKIAYRMRHKDGRWMWCETTSTLVRDPQAEGAAAIVAVTHDITERVRFEEDLQSERDRVREQAEHLAEAARSLALARQEADEARVTAEQANQAKSHFMATMSHELRTPLNAVIGFSEMIRDQVYGKGPQAWERYIEYAGDIQTSGIHLLELINDMLDLSKIEAGRLEIGPEWLDLSSLLTLSLRLVRARAAERRLKLDLVLSKPLPRLCADERAVRQIVANLLSNAIKFTPEGGRIELRARAVEPDMVEIAVADSGIGIPAEQIPRVVQPFEMLDNRFSRTAGGTGLGLALVKSLTELHGGGVAIDSEVDKGTTVTVTLPKVPPGTQPKAPPGVPSR